MIRTETPATTPRTRIARAGRRMALALAALALGAVLFAAPPAQAGRTLGPASHWDTVSGNSRDTYHVTFDGGEWSHIEALATTDDDIDMYVYDEDGALVDFDELPDNDPICTFTPPHTEQYTIHIVNRTGHAVRYHLTTN